MTSLHDYLSDGRLRRHTSTPEEIADLFRVVDRDLKDACAPLLSTDRRFATAYNAILQLATVVVRAAGFRTSGTGHHWLTFQVLPEIMGGELQERADYFDSRRRIRNMADYDAAGVVSEAEAEEILAEARHFKSAVAGWLRENHPHLCTHLE